MKDQIIINGGNPLNDCPTDWDKAKQWEDMANKDIDSKGGPEWSFDCGFKLDLDGPLISISSRFYPPKTHYGSTWDGVLSVNFMNETIKEKKFDCPTLEDLKKEVDAYILKLTEKLKLFIK